MKRLLLLLMITGCVSSRKSYTIIKLDGSKSKILYGNGKGFIKYWKWRQIKGAASTINSPNLIITQTSIDSNGGAWEGSATDNLGNEDKDTFYYPKK